jgi:hypothetical protein
MSIHDILKQVVIKKHKTDFNEYQKSKTVKFLLQNNIDIRNRLEYFYGRHRLNSISTIAIII